MRKLFPLAVIISVLFTAGYGYGFSSRGQDCTKCHTLKKAEAEALLKGVVPNPRILDIRMTPLKTMWEVDLESQGKKGLVYVDFTKRYLISGSIIDLTAKKNITQGRFSELNRVDVSKIPLGDAIVMGNKNAKHKVIVFTDPDCPFCQKLHPELKKVVSERKDIAFLIKMYPLPMHKGAYDKAKAIVCGKSLSLLDSAFQKKPLPKPNCKTSVVDENIKLAHSLGITGTPALIMPDGRLISGYEDANAIKAQVDRK
jgi:thiol:disulfide interchange protein DsbC